MPLRGVIGLGLEGGVPSPKNPDCRVSFHLQLSYLRGNMTIEKYSKPRKPISKVPNDIFPVRKFFMICAKLVNFSFRGVEKRELLEFRSWNS